MKSIYTFGGEPAHRHITAADLRSAKGVRKFTEVTATTSEEGAAAATAGIDALNAVAEDILAVRAGAPNQFITAALSFTGYATHDEILKGAMLALEQGADSVYTCRGLDVVEMLANQGIPVKAHVGLVPRKCTWTGGVRSVGKTAEEAIQLMRDVRRLEDAGAFGVEIELVPQEVTAEISARTSLVTFAIGSGSGADVIFLFMEDICGDTINPPRHVKTYGNLQTLRQQLEQERVSALTAFKQDVDSGVFPDTERSIVMNPEELEQFRQRLDETY